MLLMVLIRDDQVTKIFVSDLICKICKDYDSVVSVPCPFPIFPQAFRQTLVDMVLFTQITVSLHYQRASCMNKSICCFFFTTCCSSAQVHVSRMTRASVQHVLNAQLSEAEPTVACRAELANGGGAENNSHPMDSRYTSNQLSCHGGSPTLLHAMGSALPSTLRYSHTFLGHRSVGEIFLPENLLSHKK